MAHNPLLHCLVITTVFLLSSSKDVDVAPQSRANFKYLLWKEDQNQLSITSPPSRKPSTQFKWPWRSYEEWKRSQEKIEEEIDLILKSGRHRKPSEMSMPRKLEKHHPKILKNKRNSYKNKRKKFIAGERRLNTAKGKKPSKKFKTFLKNAQKTIRHEPKSAMGGAVLSVRYYSTEEGGNASINNTTSKSTIDANQTEDFKKISNHATPEEKQQSNSVEATDKNIQKEEGIPEQRDYQSSRHLNPGPTTQPFAGKNFGENESCILVDLSQFNGTHVCAFGSGVEQDVVNFGFYTCKRTMGNKAP